MSLQMIIVPSQKKEKTIAFSFSPWNEEIIHQKLKCCNFLTVRTELIIFFKKEHNKTQSPPVSHSEIKYSIKKKLHLFFQFVNSSGTTYQYQFLILEMGSSLTDTLLGSKDTYKLTDIRVSIYKQQNVLCHIWTGSQ